MKISEYYSKLLLLINNDKASLRVILLYALISGIIALSLPLGIQAIISFIQLGQITSSWVILTLIVVAGAIFSGWIDILQLKAIENLQLKIYTNSAFMISTVLPQIESKVINQNNLMELANRFFDTISIQKSFQKLFKDLPVSIVQIGSGFVLLSFYHPFFVFLSILLILFIVFFSAVLFQRGIATSLKESSFKYSTAHWIEEISRVVRTFKMSGSDMHLHRTDGYVSGYLDARQKHFKVIINHTQLMIAFKALVILSLLSLGGYLVIDGQINIGQFVAAEVVIILLVNSIEKLVSSFETSYDLLTSIYKLSYLFDLPREDHSKKPFNYKDGMEIIIEDLIVSDNDHSDPYTINMRINPSEKILLTSTKKSMAKKIARILAGSDDYDDGNMIVNDIDVRNINIDILRTKIGDIVDGEDLFTGTIEENIKLGRVIDSDWYKKIIEITEVDQIAYKCSNGFDTKIYSGTSTFSEIETQKILIARSLVQIPLLLVYDNAFEIFDDRYRKKILDFITSSDAPPWTIVFLSPNEYLHSKCDKVIKLKDCGVHDG